MIRLVADSSCDLPPDLVDTHRITVVPLTIRFGATEFVDGRDLTPHEFWMKLRTSATLPETAAPSAGAFLDAFTTLADDGATGVVAVCLSSEISATFQSAVIAAEQAPIPVKVVDSRSVSMALGFQVLAGAVAAEAGGDLAAVTDVCLQAVEKTHILAALDTLEFLKRGGRVGGAQALIGGLLDVKPLIGFAGGVVSPEGRVRTRSKAISAIVDRALTNADQLDALAVVHGGAPHGGAPYTGAPHGGARNTGAPHGGARNTAAPHGGAAHDSVGNRDASDLDVVIDRLRSAVPHITPVVAELGPVVGTHSGPGIIGIAYRTR